MMPHFGFPHTPHLAWLASGKPRADKVLDPEQARLFLAGDVIVEEKVDGANLGLSVNAHGELCAQNRGSFIDIGTAAGQWKPLKRWLGPRREALQAHLSPQLILFGEWCYAVHSVRYTRLPDWFLAFDVYDRAQGLFWPVDRRNALAVELGMATAPELGRGHFSLARLKSFLGPSRLSEGDAEGIYVRREGPDRLLQRAKLVRAEFLQTIEQHWSTKHIETNALQSGRAW